MPPAEEVMAAYQRIGSVSGLADHFDVPRHTVQGWARQLRKHGHAIGRAT
jgi:transposase-like protein